MVQTWCMIGLIRVQARKAADALSNNIVEQQKVKLDVNLARFSVLAAMLMKIPDKNKFLY